MDAALRGDGDKAYAPIEKLRDAEKVEAYVDLCHRLIYEEDLVAAGAAIDKALELAPEELYVLDAKSELASEDGRPEDAVAVYRTMYEIAPNDPAVIRGLGSLLLGGGDAAGAVAVLEPHAKSDDAELQLRLGEALYAADRGKEALEILEQVHDYYESKLKHASFVDNFQALKDRFDEASRLRDDVFAELNGREATIDKHARGGGLDARAGVNYTLLGSSLAAKSDHKPSRIALESSEDTQERADALLADRPDDPLGLVLRGTAELRQATLNRSVASFEAATDSNGRFFAGFLGLGAAMDCQRYDWFKNIRSLPAVDDAAGLHEVVPDWPVLSEAERLVVSASVRPLASALPALADAGTTIRLLPVDVRATDLAEFAADAGARFPDDHRSMDAIDGLATRGIAVAKIERLLDVVGDGAWTFAHEFAHLVYFGASDAMRERVETLYESALARGHDVTSYQTSNPDELFAVAYVEFLRHRYGIGVVEDLDDASINAALFQIFEQM